MEFKPNSITEQKIKELILNDFNSQKPREYVGMSAIGDECMRKIWYGFRLVADREFNINSALAITDGFRQEDVMADRLRLDKNIELITHANDEQIGFIDLGGHFRGHCDGQILGIYEAPKTWHIWEHKSVNEKKYETLIKLKNNVGEKQALCEWDYTYYIQAILYMYYSKMKRHFLTVSKPGGRDFTTCRTEANNKLAKTYIDKANVIINSDFPPERLSEKAEFYKCKWCDYQHVCHYKEVPKVNCRTCAFLKPIMECNEGEWYCYKHKTKISFTKQLEGCPEHLYLNTLVPFEVVDYDKEHDTPNWIDYNFFKNSLDEISGMTSTQIYQHGNFNFVDTTEQKLSTDDLEIKQLKELMK